MTGDSDFLFYPEGQIGMGTGDLKQCTNAMFSYTNNAKTKHAIGHSPSGFSMGPRELNGTLEFEVPETGLERDLLAQVKRGTRVPFRFKDATATDEIIGVLTKFQKTIPQGDAVKVVVDYIGKLVD